MKERYQSPADSKSRSQSSADLKDRYYWKKYEEIMYPKDSNKRFFPSFKNVVLSFLLLGFSFAAVVVLFWAASYLSQKKQGIVKPVPTPISPSLPKFFGLPPTVFKQPDDSRRFSEPPPLEVPSSSSNIISIQADSMGHFTGIVLINDVPMPFMVDTGATFTTVPTKMSYPARLVFGKAYQINTANGLTVARATRINSMKIGSLELRGIEAGTTDHLDEVIIGMNTLRLFHMTQDRNVLTLALYPEAAAQMERLPPMPLSSVQIKKTWEKTVTCDANNEHCKTSYR